MSATVDIVIPVYNEERALPGCISVLHRFLSEHFPFDWTITIVDNASTDATTAVTAELARQWSGIRTIYLDRKGKGHAIRAAWSSSQADVVAYMDVDLSTGLDALLPLVASVAGGHSDIAIGSRLAPGARTVRGAKRELLSRGYNALIRLMHRAQFRDAQCGFKAARTDVIRPLLRHVEDESWFFDTELLLLAEHNGLRVLEVPVDWVEDMDSRVNVFGVVASNVRGLFRLALAKLSGAAGIAELPARPEPTPTHPDAAVAKPARRFRSLVSFGLVGLVATALTLGLYALFRLWWPPLVANLVAVLLSTLFNTEANRRYTFQARPRSVGLAHVQAFAIFALYCGFTSGALLALDAVVANPPRWAELTVLLLSSAIGTLGRFVLLSTWVFRPRPGQTPVPPQAKESGV